MISVYSISKSAAALMNDEDQEEYTHEKLLPYLNMAYGQLERRLILIDSNKLLKTSNDVFPVGDKIDIVNRNDKILDGLIRPVDVYIYEEGISRYVKIQDYATSGSDDLIENVAEQVIVWIWEGGAIQFNTDVSGRRFKVRYYAMLNRPPADLRFPSFEGYLIYKTAAFGAEFLMENISRAKELNDEALAAWDEVKGTEVKENQSRSRQRPAFRRRRRVFA